MSYFKVNGIDFSSFVKELEVQREEIYNAQTNAAGDTVVDYINSKRTIEVGIITLGEDDASRLLNAVNSAVVSISFRNPLTKQLEENVNCLIKKKKVDYYTIQANKVLINEFSLKFEEL